MSQYIHLIFWPSIIEPRNIGLIGWQTDCANILFGDNYNRRGPSQDLWNCNWLFSMIDMAFKFEDEFFPTEGEWCRMNIFIKILKSTKPKQTESCILRRPAKVQSSFPQSWNQTVPKIKNMNSGAVLGIDRRTGAVLQVSELKDHKQGLTCNRFWIPVWWVKPDPIQLGISPLG